MSIESVERADFNANWRGIFDAVFTGEPPEARMFRDREWGLTLLPGGLLLDDDYRGALAQVARLDGASPLIAAGYDHQFEDQPAFVLDWVRSDFEHVANSVLGHIDSVLFDRSAHWGLFASPETFAVVGAAPSFLGRFESLVGGRAAVQQRFRHAVAEGEIGYRDQGRAYATLLEAAAGWEPARG